MPGKEKSIEMKSTLALFKMYDDDSELEEQWSYTWLVLLFVLEILKLVVLDSYLTDATKYLINAT